MPDTVVPRAEETPPTRRAAFRQRMLGLAPNLRGAFWILLAAMLITAMGTFVKLLGATFDSFQIAFFRALFGLAAVLPFVAHMGLAQLRSERIGLHLLRGCLGTSGMLCGIYAITHLSFADAISISYARILFLIPLAVLFLGEVVRARRWIAAGFGFVGVLIMLRPTGAIEPATFVAVLGALLVAGVAVMLKKLSATERPQTMLFYFGCISTCVALVPALLVWRQPTWSELGMMMLVGAFGASGQYCMFRGYKAGEATAIIPFDYSRLLFAGIVGFLVFQEVPDAWTLAGAAVIAGSTLYIALREARLGKRRRAAPAAVSQPAAPPS